MLLGWDWKLYLYLNFIDSIFVLSWGLPPVIFNVFGCLFRIKTRIKPSTHKYWNLSRAPISNIDVFTLSRAYLQWLHLAELFVKSPLWFWCPLKTSGLLNNQRWIKAYSSSPGPKLSAWTLSNPESEKFPFLDANIIEKH